MIETLSPVYAANLAADVYDVKSSITRDDFIAEYAQDMLIDKSSMSQGRTGGYIFNKQHVMGVLAVGQGKYKGTAFVAIKGTASLYDALTDLNAGVRISHTGFAIHQGFYYAFDSILSDMLIFATKLQNVTVIHVVGHSLGGAIATLAADWLKKNGCAPSVKLYTFGCPRVGMEPFAANCTSRLAPQNIYRVYHKTDPVPTVPTWPFYHIPNTVDGYLLYSPVATKPWEYHLMKHYIKSATTAGSWQQMSNCRPVSYMDSAIENWLKSDGLVSFTANSLELMNAALMYVVKKVLNLAGIAMVSGAACTFTLLDRMAMLLSKGAKLTTDLSIWVYHLVKKMAALIGVIITEGVDLTAEFIRIVFMRVYRRISEMIWRIGQEIA